MKELWIVLELNPEPWAIGPVGVNRSGGKVAAYVGQNKQLHAYKEGVKEQVRAKLNWSEGDPVVFTSNVRLTLFLWRNRAEYATHQSRTARNKEADATNMLKATEDAMQGIVYKNDKDNRDVRSVIVEQSTEAPSRIIIHVQEWEVFDPNEIPNTVWARTDTMQEEIDFLMDWEK